MYMNKERIRDLKLDDKTSIGYTFKCMGAGFWALKKDDFRAALQKIVLAVPFFSFFYLFIYLFFFLFIYLFYFFLFLNALI